MKNWTRGRMLNTRTTLKWSGEERALAQREEAKRVVSDFSFRDEGKSRKLVCTLNEAHPDFEENMDIILSAPENEKELRWYLKVNSCKSLEELASVIEEIGNRTGQVKGRIEYFNATVMANACRYFSLDNPNVLTRNYGIRQQATYILHYTK